MAVDVYGTKFNPFGVDPDDPRLASGAIALKDDTSGVVLNFEVSNRRIVALRELFAISAPQEGGVVLPMADPYLTECKIEPGSWHHYEIRYNPGDDGLFKPGADVAEWLVDRNLVRRVEWVATIAAPAAPVIKPVRFRIGMGIFTLLDDLPDGRGGILPGLDPNYEHTIFGQGARVSWRKLMVSTN
jgi:hypothetical protein